MDRRKAVEKIIERIYKDRLKRTGRLPAVSEIREMEKKAAGAAERRERKPAK